MRRQLWVHEPQSDIGFEPAERIAGSHPEVGGTFDGEDFASLRQVADSVSPPEFTLRGSLSFQILDDFRGDGKAAPLGVIAGCLFTRNFFKNTTNALFFIFIEEDAAVTTDFVPRDLLNGGNGVGLIVGKSFDDLGKVGARFAFDSQIIAEHVDKRIRTDERFGGQSRGGITIGQIGRLKGELNFGLVPNLTETV